MFRSGSQLVVFGLPARGSHTTLQGGLASPCSGRTLSNEVKVSDRTFVIGET